MNTDEQQYPPANKFFPLSRRKSFYSIPNAASVYIGVFQTSQLQPLTDPIKEYSKHIYELLIESLMEENDDVPEVPETEEKCGNIILDMDGTLGDNIPASFPENPVSVGSCVPIPRPGLKKFLAFVFSRYERVSIWTAASSDWYFTFKESVLRPNMPPGAAFHFERTRNLNVPYVPLKPLSEIYAEYPEEYNESNTTIVDDNVETFQDNRDNAVHIPPFFYDRLGGSPETRRKTAAKDRGLYTTIEILTARQNRISSKI